MLGVKSEPKRSAKSLDFSISIGPVIVCFFFCLFLTAENHEPRADSTSSFLPVRFHFRDLSGNGMVAAVSRISASFATILMSVLIEIPISATSFCLGSPAFILSSIFNLSATERVILFFGVAMLAAFEQGISCEHLSLAYYSPSHGVAALTVAGKFVVKVDTWPRLTRHISVLATIRPDI